MSNGGFEHTDLQVMKQDGRSAVRLYTAQPTPLEERNLGVIFTILEVDSREKNRDEILDILIDELHNSYYSSETLEVDSSFEHALHRVNIRIAEVVSEVGDDWLRSCNMIIGVHRGHHVVFTHIGRVIGMLFVREQLMEVIDSGSRVQELNPLKFFSNIVSGDMPDRGILLFATEGMMDYLSKETVRRIITSQKASHAVSELSELLSVDTGDRNFIGKILTPVSAYGAGITGAAGGASAGAGSNVEPVGGNRNSSGHQNGNGQGGAAHSSDSMESLMSRQQQTEELLTSSLWPSLKKSMKEMVSSRFEKQSDEEDDYRAPKPVQREPQHDEYADYTDDARGIPEGRSMQQQVEARDSVPHTDADRGGSAGRVPQGGEQGRGYGEVIGTGAASLGRGLMVVAAALQSGFLALSRAIQNTYRKARGQQTHASQYGGTARSSYHTGSWKRSLARFFSGVMQKFMRLSIAQKVFVIVAVVVFAWFAQSVINRGADNSSSSQEDQYAQIISQVDVKVNEGKAAELIDGNAQPSYAAARNLLAQVPQNSKAYKQRGEELNRIISEALQKTQKMKDLGTASPVLDFSSINGNLQVKHMVLLGSSVYAFDASNGSTYRGNLENNSAITAVNSSSSDERIIAASKASPGTAAVVQPNNVVGTFSPLSDSIAPIELSFGTPAQNIIDVVVFGGTRVYTLDSGTNQIVRNRQEGTGYIGGENWLTDSDADVRNAVGMAIDGAIYVLGSDGKLKKFNAGTQDSGFALGGIEPALDSAVALSTDENTTNIYVADSKNKRVVVFDKNGELVQQYTASTFENIVDVVADEANKRVFVLTQNGKVFEIDL